MKKLLLFLLITLLSLSVFPQYYGGYLNNFSVPFMKYVPADTSTSYLKQEGIIVYEGTANTYLYYTGTAWALVGANGALIDSAKLNDSLALFTRLDSISHYWDSLTVMSHLGDSSSGALGSLTLVDSFALRSFAIGDSTTLTSLTDGEDNIAFGWKTLQSLTGGDRNIGIGYNVLNDVTTGYNNVAIGHNAGEKITGNSIVAIGYEALDNTTTGTYSIGIGYQVGHGLDATDGYNTLIGALAGQLSNGEYNLYLGINAGYKTAGSDNIFIGNYVADSAQGTGKIIIGHEFGADALTSYTFLLGYQTDTLLKGTLKGDKQLTVYGDMNIERMTRLQSGRLNAAGDTVFMGSDTIVTFVVGWMFIDSTGDDSLFTYLGTRGWLKQ